MTNKQIESVEKKKYFIMRCYEITEDGVAYGIIDNLEGACAIGLQHGMKELVLPNYGEIVNHTLDSDALEKFTGYEVGEKYLCKYANNRIMAAGSPIARIKNQKFPVKEKITSWFENEPEEVALEFELSKRAANQLRILQKAYGFSLSLKAHNLELKTIRGTWKIEMAKNGKYSLMHENHGIRKSTKLNKKDLTGWHTQMIEDGTCSFSGYLSYIVAHDYGKYNMVEKKKTKIAV